MTPFHTEILTGSYEAAFATINRRFALQGRKAISMLTLFAGFASTVFWPLTQVLDTSLGWRDTYLLYGAFHLIICLPLHMLLGKEQARPISRQNAHRGHTLVEAIRHPAFWKLAIAFAANVLVFAALSVHLLPLLQELGHSAELAVMMAMLIGPMQVAGRVLERTVGRNCIPQTVGIFCFATLPAALTVIVLSSLKLLTISKSLSSVYFFSFVVFLSLSLYLLYKAS